MPRTESLHTADWLRIAEKDYTRIQRLLEAHDPEAAGFYLQQAVENFSRHSCSPKDGNSNAFTI